MVRRSKPSPEGKIRQKYDETRLKEAISKCVENGWSLRVAEAKTKIPRSTLHDYLKNLGPDSLITLRIKKLGKKFILSEIEEKVLIDILQLAAEWGCPFEVQDVQIIVRDYLNGIPRKVDCFKNNTPGQDWVRSFLKRHSQLKIKFAENIKRSRAAVSRQAIRDYFNQLQSTLENVEPQNIVNYDESAFVDDPKKKRCIVKTGARAENITDHTKVSTSVMFAVSGSGNLLPPYIVYKADGIYDTWTENGPTGARYNRTKSGWFTGDIFEDWFLTICRPYFHRRSGPKVLIGDNLASHVSYRIISKALDEGIKFVFLPANATHLCQPLDVCVFRALKCNWSKVLTRWKQKNKGPLQKCFFPKLLNDCILETVNMKEDIISGFRASGLIPFNPDMVLQKIPDKQEAAEIGKRYLVPVIELLHSHRFGDKPQISRKKKINTPAGKSVGLEDFGASVSNENQGTGTHSNDNPRNEDENSEVVDCPSSDDDSDAAESTRTINVTPNTAQNSGVDSSPAVLLGHFYAVKFETEFDKRTRIYVGRATQYFANENTAEFSFLRRKRPHDPVFAFPNKVDVEKASINSILQKMELISERRGIFNFNNVPENYL